MSFRGRFFTLITVAGATLAFSTAALAQDSTPVTPKTDKTEKIQRGDGGFEKGRGGKEGFGRRGGPGMRGEGGPMGMLRGLNLTDDQKKQIQSILEANRPNRNAQNRDEIRTLIEAKRNGTLTTDQQARLKAIRTQAMTENQAKMKAVHEQILAVLTPEQKAQLEQRHKDMKDHMKMREEKREQKTATPTKDN